MLKLTNRYYKKLWLKGASTFEQQTGITLKLVIEKTLCRQMRHRFQHFWRFLSIQIHSQRIKPEIQKRTPNLIHLWSKQIWEPIAKVSAKSNRKKFQSKKRNTVRKKSFQQRRQLYLWIQRSERKAASSFNRLCLKNIGAPGQRQVCISKSSNFFWASRARNTLQACARSPTSECLNKLH